MKNPIDKQTMNSLFAWATSSWYTKLMFGIILLIISIRLATTCISIFGIEIGCETGSPYLEAYEESDDVFGPKLPPKE